MVEKVKKVTVERLGILLQPTDDNHSKFNAGMIRHGDHVEMLYRSAEIRNNPDGKSLDYVSDCIVRAQLDLKGNLIRDFEVPYIAPFNDASVKGCQDPRIIAFEGWYYIFFAVYDGGCARVGIAKTQDFTDVEIIGVIPTLQWDKDAFIFPERLHGKIAYIHRIEPNIQMEYFDTIEDMLDETYWLNYEERLDDQVILEGKYVWENQKIGGGVPPIRTDRGWLFLYHSVSDDREPFCYRCGAALLDLDDPTRVIARLPYPLLEPTEAYETTGDVNNVVFPQGAFFEDGWLYISYGAADKRVAIARVRYDELLDALSENPEC